MVVLVGARRALLRDARPEKSRVCTKPSSVLAERKLLMRLDGVCRHYLAMTKSALFLFTGGGKFNRGTRKKKSIWKQVLMTLRLFFCCCFFPLLFHLPLPFLFLCSVTKLHSLLRTEVWITTLPHWLIFKMLLAPEDDTFLSDPKSVPFVCRKLETSSTLRL